MIERILILTILVCGGCSSQQRIAAEEVLNHGECRIAQADMRVVSYADVARLRGSTLLNMTSPPPEQGSDQPADLLLVAISRGPQPTPGYRFELGDAFLDNDVAILALRWIEPAADAVLAQVITHPCIVVGLERGGYRRVRAVDDRGTVLGEVSL